MTKQEKKLREYIEETLKVENEYEPELCKSWVFGAINYAQRAGIVSEEICYKLLREYKLI